MVNFVKRNRALCIGAAGSILVTVGQVMTGDLTVDAAIPLVVGAVTHLFVSPADKVGV